MRIAVPVAGGRLELHFGHADAFVLFDVDEPAGKIVSSRELPTPPHEPGRLPAWLKDQGADAVIAGGMGPRAAAMLERLAIQVIGGAPSADPRQLVEQWLAGSLAACDAGCQGGGPHGGCRR